MISADRLSQAEFAVADIVQAVPYYSLERYRRYSHLTPEDLNEILRKETWGECSAASAHSLYMLQVKHSELFDRLALLRSEVTRQDPQTQFKNPQFYSHAYFLARFREFPQTWFASSPANFQEGKFNPLTTIFRSPQLKNVLRAIQERDGGQWPNDSQVVGLLDEECQAPILISDNLVEVTEVLKRKGEVTRQRKRVPLSVRYPTGRF